MAGATGDGQAPLSGDNRSDSLLNRAELLLAAAEAVQSKGDGGKETALQEALGRMLTSSALLRNEVMSNSSAMLEQARRERDRIAAEIEVLRAERDLCLALAIEAGSAAGRQVAERLELRSTDSSRRTYRETDEPAAGTLGDLIEAKVGPDASSTVDQATLTVAGIGGLLDVSKIEEALDALPNLRHLAVRTIKDGLATIDLTLFPPTATLIVAVDLLSLAGSELRVTAVGRGVIEASVSSRGARHGQFGQRLQYSRC